MSFSFCLPSDVVCDVFKWFKHIMEFSAKELNNGFNIVNGHIEMFTMKLLQVTYFIHKENPLSLIIYPLE